MLPSNSNIIPTAVEIEGHNLLNEDIRLVLEKRIQEAHANWQKIVSQNTTTLVKTPKAE